MRRIPILTAALAATLFIASCKDSGTSGLDIPKDAGIVVHINTSSLTSKLSWNEIKASGWFKELAEENHDSLAKKLMEDPEKSGLDLKSDFVFFTKSQNRGGYMVFEGKLKDAAAFEAMVKQMNGDAAEVMKDGDVKYIKTGSHQIVSWTGSKFIAMTDAPYLQPFVGGTPRAYPIDSLKKFTKDLLALKNSNKLERDDRFSNLLKESGDIHFWMNSSQYMNSMGYVSMLKIGSLLEGIAFTYSVSFDDGKIVAKTKAYYGKEMAKLMDKYKSREIDAALLNRIPSNDVVGVMALNIDPGMTQEFLKASGFDGMVNGFLGEMNLTADELINSTKGQFLFSLSDLQIKSHEMTIPGYDGGKPHTYSSKKPDMNVLVAASVNNRSTFDKLLSMFKEKMNDEGDTTVKYQVTNDWFVASNKKATVDQFLAGSNNKASFADKITGSSFGFYIDLQKVVKVFGSELKDASDSASFDANARMWQDVVGKGGEYKNGVATGEFVINLVDKSKNSLKQLNEFADKMSAAQKLKKKDVWMDGSGIDSVRVDAPAVVTPQSN